MRGAILPIAAAALLSGCATKPPQVAMAAPQRAKADFSHLSCSQIASELALAEQAYNAIARRDRQSREDQSAQAYLFPASLGASTPRAGDKLLARIEDLRRASRAKRCTSALLRENATA